MDNKANRFNVERWITIAKMEGWEAALRQGWLLQGVADSEFYYLLVTGHFEYVFDERTSSEAKGLVEEILEALEGRGYA